jgi:hypothetical protein
MTTEIRNPSAGSTGVSASAEFLDGRSETEIIHALTDRQAEIAESPVKSTQVRRRQQPERALQIALVGHLQWRAPPDLWWAHYPSGGRRSRIAGAILKGMGARAGVPDLLLVSRGKLFAIELKSDHGRLSPVQRETHAAMRKAGVVIGVAGDIDQALGLLDTWGLIR